VMLFLEVLGVAAWIVGVCVLLVGGPMLFADALDYPRPAIAVGTVVAGCVVVLAVLIWVPH
jgi:hypothetical protein